MDDPATIEIAGRAIGPGHPTYVVAELSGNHGQDRDRAMRMVEAACEAGADAVKLQTYRPDTITIDSDKEPFRIESGTMWDGRTLHDLYDEAYTPWDWQPDLKERAEDLGMDLFSSAFDASAVEFLEKMDVPAYKVASFEIVDLPLIRRMAKTGKPLIVSTGMSRLEEIEEAVEAARQAGCDELALLKCTSAYPAPPEEMNLRTIPDLWERFDVPVGLSDHTLGVEAPVAAVALGACIVEKHLCLSRDHEGPDTDFSLTTEQFSDMVDAVRTTEAALGDVRYGPQDEESRSLVFRRSLFVVEDTAEGEPFTRDNVRSIRPGDGLHPRHLDDVLGRQATRDVERGTPLDWDLVEGDDG